MRDAFQSVTPKRPLWSEKTGAAAPLREVARARENVRDAAGCLLIVAHRLLLIEPDFLEVPLFRNWRVVFEFGDKGDEIGNVIEEGHRHLCFE